MVDARLINQLSSVLGSGLSQLGNIKRDAETKRILEDRALTESMAESGNEAFMVEALNRVGIIPKALPYEGDTYQNIYQTGLSGVGSIVPAINQPFEETSPYESLVEKLVQEKPDTFESIVEAAKQQRVKDFQSTLRDFRSKLKSDKEATRLAVAFTQGKTKAAEAKQAQVTELKEQYYKSKLGAEELRKQQEAADGISRVVFPTANGYTITEVKPVTDFSIEERHLAVAQKKAMEKAYAELGEKVKVTLKEENGRIKNTVVSVENPAGVDATFRNMAKNNGTSELLNSYMARRGADVDPLKKPIESIWTKPNMVELAKNKNLPVKKTDKAQLKKETLEGIPAGFENDVTVVERLEKIDAMPDEYVDVEKLNTVEKAILSYEYDGSNLVRLGVLTPGQFRSQLQQSLPGENIIQSFKPRPNVDSKVQRGIQTIITERVKKLREEGAGVQAIENYLKEVQKQPEFDKYFVGI